MIGEAARVPNPALQHLEVLVGEWRATGTHPMLPGRTIRGTTSWEWHEGGAFLLMRSHMDDPDIPDGVAIIASDDAAGTYFMSYFDERGTSRRYDLDLTADGVAWSRDEAGFGQRTTLVIEADGSRMVGTGEMSRDGGAWEGDLSLTYERV